ncbi:YmdB family metallophosphoesterase, partial [candidate division WOR-3 bacterium]|nr:YmdB family metallophosphoesterase [candidate division WOR-3 bacterium]
VINLEGRVFMNPLDCPFRTMDKILNEIGRNRIIFIDFHAEASAEKQALGLYLDGKVSAVVGTHTHVQTADERILPNGTAYITDAGMTGALNSVIGFNSSNSIERIILQIPKRLNISSNKPVINGVFIDIDTHTKKAVSIKRLFEYEKNIGQEHISEDN